MRPIAEMQTVQVEITNFCQLKCSQCTRFCGHHVKPFFMTTEEFRAAIDSLVGYSEQPHAIVGFMGGSPEWHPKFEEFCDYSLAKIGREKLGLWGTFPPAKRHLREAICRTFSCILLNDHTRDDILHAPVLMAAEDCFRKPCAVCGGRGKVALPPDSVNQLMRLDGGYTCSTCNGLGTVTDDAALFSATERCWIQESWSASINPKGAWFCEVAAALSDLFDGPKGWDVEPDWWKRTTKDFTAQRDWACRKCGAALPLARIRNSQDPTDDVSASNLERLKAIKSRKVARGEFALHQDFQIDQRLLSNHGYPNQTYQDEMYRKAIAYRYGIGLRLNERGYWDPFLLPEGAELEKRPPSLFTILQDAYSGGVPAAAR